MKPAHNKQKGHNFKKSNTKPDAKKSVDHYCFYIGSVNRVSDYDTTLQFIVHHIKKTCVRGNDTSEALRTNVKPDVSKNEPTLEFEELMEIVDNARMNKQHELYDCAFGTETPFFFSMQK